MFRVVCCPILYFCSVISLTRKEESNHKQTFNIMKMKKTFLLSAVALAVLGACTNDEYEGRDMAGSKLAVSASINEVRTRVSDNGTDWTTGDVIVVSDDQGLQQGRTHVPG